MKDYYFTDSLINESETQHYKYIHVKFTSDIVYFHSLLPASTYKKKSIQTFITKMKFRPELFLSRNNQY